MPAKQIEVLVPAIKLRWEYRVVWVYGGKFQSSNQFSILLSRREAREYRKSIDHRLKPKIQRRLVQANWDDYKDTFGWNSGCGKR